jgi:drug/metabolite transporter (DMT)-like permease
MKLRTPESLPAAPILSDTARGIALKLGSVLLFTIMASCVKAARDVAPPGETVFFRSFFAIPPILIYAWMRGRMADVFVARDPLAHATRGVVGVTSMFAGFTALAYIPLPEQIAIGFAAPLIATGLAALLLRERVRLFRWAAVAIGLVGVIVMIEPRLTLAAGGGVGDRESLGAGFALMAAATAAFATIHIRKLVQTETTLSIVFWFSVTCTLAGLATAPFGWAWPEPSIFALLVAAGLLGGTAQILLTESYVHADASTLAPFDYSSMLYALLIGWLIFAEIPTAQVLVGAAIVIAAGLFIIYREHRLRIDRSKPRSAGSMQS